MLTSYFGSPEILGIPEIDDDHRKIAAIHDALIGQLVEGSDRAVILAKLSELIDAMCDHFNREEEMMRLSHYPDADAHKRDHDMFLQKIGKILTDHQTNNPELTRDTVDMVRSWKLGHMKNHDRPFILTILST